MKFLLKNHVGVGIYHTIAGLTLLQLDDHDLTADAVFVSKLDVEMIRESLFLERPHAFELAFEDGVRMRGEFQVLTLGPIKTVKHEQVHFIKLRRLGKAHVV